jgi:hypothetical protein
LADEDPTGGRADWDMDTRLAVGPATENEINCQFTACPLGSTVNFCRINNNKRSDMKIRVFVLIAGVVLIGVAIGIQAFGLSQKRKSFVAPIASELIPRAINGWVVKDIPIAESEEMKQAVKEALNFDSAIFRSYKRGNDEISIYLAYWLPGSINPEQVDGHTPDICWVNNGWKMEKPKPPSNLDINGHSLPMLNYRKFEAQGHGLSVLFWHLTGSEYRQSFSVFEEGLGFWDRAERRVNQVWKAVTTPARQQLFIRISSNRNVADQLNEPPVKACIDLISRVMGGEVLYTTQ